MMEEQKIEACSGRRVLMKKSYLIRTGIIAAVLIAGASIYVGFAGGGKSYLAETVTRGSIAETVDADGKVKGEEEKTYYAEVTAPIETMDIEVGDLVSKGDKIITFDMKDLEKSYNQAILQVEASESGMNAQIQKSNENAAKKSKATADEEAYKILYALSRSDADSLTQDQYSEAYQIQCQYDSIQKKIADKNREIAEKKVDLEEVEDPESEKYRDLSEDIADLGVEVADLQKSLTTLPTGDMTPEENAHATYDSNVMEDIVRNWSEATTDAATAENYIINEEQKEQLQKSHELTELNADTVEDNLSIARGGVKSEFNGIITKVDTASGAVVSKGMPLFTMESTDQVKVDVELSKYDIAKVKEGQKADISIAGTMYEGTVSNIKRLAVTDAKDKAKVTVGVHIENPDENIILGLEADVDIHTEQKEDALLIPAAAYYSDDEGDYCYVIQEGKIAKKYIETGVESEDYIEVISGIEENEVVITDAITDEQIGKKAVAK